MSNQSNVKRGRYLLYKDLGYKQIPYGPRPRKRKCTVPSEINVNIIHIKYFY